MPYRSLAAVPFPDNDVVVLAKLFEVSIDFFRSHQSPNAQDFIGELRTIAGLGLTACLVDNGYLLPYQTYFNRFIDSEQGNLIENQTNHASVWGQTLANMVVIGLDSFRRSNYPDYYTEFREAVKNAIERIHVMEHVGTRKIERILKLLPMPVKRHTL